MLFLGYHTVMAESYETGNKNRIHIPQHCMNNRQKMFLGINCIFIRILARGTRRAVLDFLRMMG